MLGNTGVEDSESKLAEGNLTIRTVSEPENDDSEGRSHGLSELDEID
jgi:hypothetical protein